MDGQVYNRAVGRIAELQAELKRLEAFIVTYRELADEDVEPEPSRPTQERPVHEIEEQQDGVDDADRPRATPQAELKRVVEQVLLTNGAPLQRFELMERVKALGMVIGGRNEITNFGSKLSRAERLVNLPKLGYWPKDEPYEPGGYQPGSAGLQVAA
jgi:hypothetical protein